jgi:hypothetical protein
MGYASGAAIQHLHLAKQQYVALPYGLIDRNLDIDKA